MVSFVLVVLCWAYTLVVEAVSEADNLACHNGPSAHEGTQPAKGDRGTALLQHTRMTGNKVMLSSKTEEMPTLTRRKGRLEVIANVPNQSGPLPICHRSIVAWTCYNLNGGHQGAVNVTKDQIQDLAALNDTAIDNFWDALNLTRVGSSVPCALLCTSVVEYVKAHGILPPSSDRACHTVDGNTSCDLDVAPPKLLEEMADGADFRPDSGFRVEQPSSHNGLIQHSIEMTEDGDVQVVKRSVAMEGTPEGEEDLVEEQPQKDPTSCPYSLWETVELIANFFRIYPSRGQSPVIDGPSPSLAQGGAAATASQVIADNNVLAKAWASQVVVELANWRTGPWRQEWFGGSGMKTQSQVRDRIVLVMNFIARELDTVRYVYPADDVVNTACTGNTAAYVWKSSASNGNNYYETTGPTCGSSTSPRRKPCGKDSSGRFVVYLCQRWLSSPNSWRVATLIHEAAHHTGPTDESYDINVMKQLSQTRQLNNAASYEHFAKNVANAAWGCTDNDPPNVAFSCNPGPCACVSLAPYCQDATYGATVRGQCPSTCGVCNGQMPGPTPTPPPPPPPSGGCSDKNPPSFPFSCSGGPCTCVSLTSYCQDATYGATIRGQCPSTCGVCDGQTSGPSPTPAPTPSPPPPPPPSSGCSEPSTKVKVVLGGVTYRGYCSNYAARNACRFNAVKSACPVSCGTCGSCSDDPTYTIQTQYGLWTCDNWKPYVCWEEVEPHCPVSCRMAGCV